MGAIKGNAGRTSDFGLSFPRDRSAMDDEQIHQTPAPRLALRQGTRPP